MHDATTKHNTKEEDLLKKPLLNLKMTRTKKKSKIGYLFYLTLTEELKMKQEKEKNCRRYTAWNVNKKSKLLKGAARLTQQQR